MSEKRQYNQKQQIKNVSKQNSAKTTPTHRDLKNQESIGRQNSAGKSQSPEQVTKQGSQGQRTRNGRAVRAAPVLSHSQSAVEKKNNINKQDSLLRGSSEVGAVFQIDNTNK